MSGAAMPAALAGPSRDPGVATALSRRRQRRNVVIKVLCVAATAIGLAVLASILFTLLRLGIGGLSLTVFTHVTMPSGDNGGLLNPIVGSLIQTALGAAIGTPIGIMVGTYLSEYARSSALGNAVRFVSDVLLSAPSILIGLFIYQLFVNGRGYSGIAGALSLAVIVIPIVVRTTEDMLTLIPISLREAAVALGAPKWKAIVLICYRAALDGIATGVLLAIARVAGETAPLLFTSLGNDNWSIDLTKPMSSLPLTIYKYAGSPADDWVQLAWVGAMLITFGVLALNIVARVALRPRR
jgi:phosphate transport system permease protein